VSIGKNTVDFFFRSDTGRWLSFLRMGLGLQVLFSVLSLRADWNLLFGGGHSGLLGREVGDAMTVVQSPFIPHLDWIVSLLSKAGVNENAALALVWWSFLVLGGLMLLGLFCRPVAVTAWFLQLACAKSGGLLSYGADNLTTIGLFYLMIAPFPDPWSIDRILLQRTTSDPQLLGFHRRALQLHLCLIYFFGGLTKCLGAGWWNGTNLWRSLTIPPFDVLPIDWVASFGFLLPTAGITICLLEVTYPFFIWWRRSRKAALVAICAMHLGIAMIMGMVLFGAIMIILNLAAFWPYEEKSIPSEVANANLRPSHIAKTLAAEKIAAEGI
jgi:hypothetical protein